MLTWEDIPLEEKIRVARDLVADNVAEILKREMLISSLSWEKTSITLKARDCRDSDINIKKFLTILWAKEIQVNSDFPCRADSYYEWTTTIEFRY